VIENLAQICEAGDLQIEGGDGSDLLMHVFEPSLPDLHKK